MDDLLEQTWEAIEVQLISYVAMKLISHDDEVERIRQRLVDLFALLIAA